MDRVAGTEPASCQQLVGELPPMPLPIHLHLSWQCPALHPSLGAFLSRIGSRAHPRSRCRDRKARTLKWSSQIQFSLVNWASACTRFCRGERLTRWPGVPPRLCHRLLMMFACCTSLRGELGVSWAAWGRDSQPRGDGMPAWQGARHVARADPAAAEQHYQPRSQTCTANLSFQGTQRARRKFALAEFTPTFCSCKHPSKTGHRQLGCSHATLRVPLWMYWSLCKLKAVSWVSQGSVTTCAFIKVYFWTRASESQVLKTQFIFCFLNITIMP